MKLILNNSYLSGFFESNILIKFIISNKKPVILSFDKVAESILALTKINFFLFIKIVNIFNMKVSISG